MAEVLALAVGELAELVLRRHLQVPVDLVALVKPQQLWVHLLLMLVGAAVLVTQL
jgi:hypothetical protein